MRNLSACPSIFQAFQSSWCVSLMNVLQIQLPKLCPSWLACRNGDGLLTAAELKAGQLKTVAPSIKMETTWPKLEKTALWIFLHVFLWCISSGLEKGGLKDNIPGDLQVMLIHVHMQGNSCSNAAVCCDPSRQLTWACKALGLEVLRVIWTRRLWKVLMQMAAVWSITLSFL